MCTFERVSRRLKVRVCVVCLVAKFSPSAYEIHAKRKNTKSPGLVKAEKNPDEKDCANIHKREIIRMLVTLYSSCI